MKKLFFAILLLPFFVACNQKELKQLREQNAQLQMETHQNDSVINDFVESFDAIQQNLAAIKEKQNIIDVSTQESPNRTRKEKITSDLIAINDLLEKNKAELDDLNKKLKNSYLQNTKLTKLVENLKQQIADKEAEIASLQEQVAALNIDVKNLTGKVQTLNENLDAATADNAAKAKTIEEKTSELNTAYYIVGTTKELKDKKIINRDGGLLGIGKSSKLGQDFDPALFTKIDITKTSSIKISAKKITLVTSHPNGSYQIDGTDKAVEGITILDAKEFWKASKFLVISVQ
jgi:DNA repair exonuclease SbcCD ATPase subunit